MAPCILCNDESVYKNIEAQIEKKHIGREKNHRCKNIVDGKEWCRARYLNSALGRYADSAYCEGMEHVCNVVDEDSTPCDQGFVFRRNLHQHIKCSVTEKVGGAVHCTMTVKCTSQRFDVVRSRRPLVPRSGNCHLFCPYGHRASLSRPVR